MKKPYKIEITKHIKRNGSFFFTGKVLIMRTLNLFLFKVKYCQAYYLHGWYTHGLSSKSKDKFYFKSPEYDHLYRLLDYAAREFINAENKDKEYQLNQDQNEIIQSIVV